MKRPIKIADWIHVMAGVFVLVSLGLGTWVHPCWYVLTAFVGLNLLQFGFTGLCPFGVVVEDLGVPEE
jgi:hypothetical protein